MDERRVRCGERAQHGASGASARRSARRLWIRPAALAGAGLVAAIAVLSLGAGAEATPSSSTKLVPGYLNGLPLATRVGAAPGQRKMTIGVSLQRPDTAGELALFRAMYQVGSPQYHHFLTPAQFNRRFGVPTAQSAAVRRWLVSGGLQIQSAAVSGDYFTANGTVAQLDRLLGVSIGSYTFKGQSFIANDRPPSVPTGLPIAGIAGLDTINRFTPGRLHGHVLTGLPTGSGGLLPTGSAPAAGKAVGPQPGVENEFTPQELWGIYDDPGAAALTKPDGTSSPATLESSRYSLGQGQTIGIFGEGETSSVVDQLRLFETAMGFPKVPVRTVHTEGGPDSAYGDNTGAIEWYLDSQASTGMAPDVSQLDFYFAKTLFDADIFADFQAWADDPNGPREMNASFGECEANPTNPVTGPLAQQPYGTELGDELQAMGDPILRQASMEGRTLFSSAGDTGSGCPELVAPVVGAGNGVAIQPVPFVGYPCDSQYVVCVGGTVVSANGDTYPSAAQRAAETNWTYSGGGSSHFIAEPAYQQGVAHINIPCTSQPDGRPYSGVPPTCRGVPDVADLSGNITGDGYFIYIDGEPSSEGGTSLSSPLMLGQWARVQGAASRSVQGAGGLGFANPVIYHQASDADNCNSSPCPNAPVYNRDFYDVTQSEFGAGNGVYQPTPGWDYASGWGSLNVANFIQDVDGKTQAAQAATAPERPAVQVTTASMTSPAGNATDPLDVSLGNQPSLDLTRATLTTSRNGATIIATLTGPSLGNSPPPDAPGGNIFRVAWEYKGEVYYAEADQPSAGTFTYSSGNTGKYGTPSTYGYNSTPSSGATGSYDAATHTIKINVPAREVGSPVIGSALTVPHAFDQLNSGALSVTTDSADDVAPISSDGGRADSIGLEVIVGGVPASAACRAGPVVHGVGHVNPGGIVASGSASNGGCLGHITSVHVAVAKLVGKRCRFLRPDGKSLGPVTSCQARNFRLARGTTEWSYAAHLHLNSGAYLLFAHATNSRNRTGPNQRLVLHLNALSPQFTG